MSAAPTPAPGDIFDVKKVRKLHKAQKVKIK